MYRVALSLLAPKYHLNMIIFPREGNVWNLGVTHETYKGFLFGSAGSTWVGREEEKEVKRRECSFGLCSAVLLLTVSILERALSPQKCFL